ncbi:UbiA family prenyltransferase [Methanobacterium alcaliphilum]|uniref:UbiA family prenyltransferase n=1 Tax=Methanobacterium alcaliphilum TaxID=392018 RepID=UPI002009F465|nr:UbiA family prenyltransferase [Methanobacterium alcaliphilum]MCK9151213.1 UbiA family prenyltransferase [Methanobacterium alcaliphilum]
MTFVMDGIRPFNKYLSLLLSEIFYGGYYAALGSPFLILSVSLILSLKCDFPILSISYLLPLIVYSYDYYKDLEIDKLSNSKRTEYLSKKKSFYPFILFSYVLVLLSLLFLFSNFKLNLFIGGIIISGILYTKAFKGITKKIPLFKNIYTALTWSSGGTFFILFYNIMEVKLSFILIFIFIFMRVLINIIFFDLKDIESDKRESLKTLPVILGKQKCILFLHGLNLFSLFPLFIGIYNQLIPFFSFSLSFFYFYVFYYIHKSENYENEELGLISHGMADSEFILWPFILALASISVVS